MRKITKLITLAIVSVFLFSNLAIASSPTSDFQDTQSNQTCSSNYTQNEETQSRKIHNKVLEQGLATLNSDGTITVNANTDA